MSVERFEYPQSPGDCYIELDEVIEGNLTGEGDDRLILDADGAANYLASIISDFTGDEVDGDGDAWSIVCEHLAGLLDILRIVINIPEHDQIRNLLADEYGMSIPPRPRPVPQQE
jgi:hypothetical protein